MNWPGKLTPRKLTGPMHAVDWTPTLTKLVDCRPKQDPRWDGQDVWPLLTGAVETPEPRSIYIAHPSGQVVGATAGS